MKKILNTGLLAAFLIVVATMVTVHANAQGNPGGPGTNGSGTLGNGNPVGGGPVAPFDGGMSLMLVASGVGYAAKKLKRKK